MSTTCYDSPGSYANLRVDNWPDEDPYHPLKPVYAALMKAAYKPDIYNDNTFAEICGDECSGAGYIAGGVEVRCNNTIGTTVTDMESLFVEWDEDDFDGAPPAPLWFIPAEEGDIKNVGPLEPRYCVYYLHSGDGQLISYQELVPGWSIVPGVFENVFVVLEEDAALWLAGPSLKDRLKVK